MNKPKISTAYLKNIFYPEMLKETVNTLIEVLKELEEGVMPFDAIACQGISGTLICGALAYETNKHLIVVRKDLNTHSHCLIEGLQGWGTQEFNYVIVDDCIETGSTIANILKQVEGFTNGAGVCIQTVLYADDKDYDEIWEDIECADVQDGQDNAQVINCFGGGKTAFTSIMV